ncbi:MAG: hypothetical protein ACOX8B_03065 [Lachnospiraceae bacterium]|jgi:hypothetical protein
MAWSISAAGLILLAAGYAAAERGSACLAARAGEKGIFRAFLLLAAPAALLVMAVVLSGAAADSAGSVAFASVCCVILFCLCGGAGRVVTASPVPVRERARDAVPAGAVLLYLCIRGSGTLTDSSRTAVLTTADGVVLLAAAAASLILLAATGASGYPDPRGGKQLLPVLPAMLVLCAGFAALSAGWVLLHEGSFLGSAFSPAAFGVLFAAAAAAVLLPGIIAGARKGNGTVGAAQKTAAALAAEAGIGIHAILSGVQLTRSTVWVLAAGAACVWLDFLLPAEKKRAVRVCGAVEVLAGTAAVLFVILKAA